jgi:hypothetical protein
MSPEARATIVTSLGWGLVVAVAGYAITRVLEVVFGTAPDPGKVAFSLHSSLFWRSLTMLYGGGIASFVAWTASRGHLLASARALASAIPVAWALIALQALLFP